MHEILNIITMVAFMAAVIAFALSIFDLLWSSLRKGKEIAAEQIKIIKMIKRSIELKEFYSGAMIKPIQFEDGEAKKKDEKKN